MADYISREAAIAIFRAKADMGVLTPAQTYFTRAADMIALLPAADVEPVRHGEWERIDDDWNSLSAFRCSVCGEEWCFEIDEDFQLLNYNYCPNCGAKMQGGESNDN